LRAFYFYTPFKQSAARIGGLAFQKLGRLCDVSEIGDFLGWQKIWILQRAWRVRG
jgi:hypothetical protein